MGLRIKKFVYDGFSLKNLIFRFGSQKKQYVGGGGGGSKKRGLGQFANLRKSLVKKRGVVFLRGIDTEMDVMGNLTIDSF